MAPTRLVLLLVLETLLAPLAARMCCCCAGECPGAAREASKSPAHACCADRAAPDTSGLSRGPCRDGCQAKPAPATSETGSLPGLVPEEALPLRIATGVPLREAGALELVAFRGGAPPPERPPLYLLTAALRI